MSSADTPDRFLVAQDGVFETAMEELRRGHKTSHWIWFVFPQLRGLGISQTATYYGLAGIDEARRYHDHSLLRERLHAACAAILAWSGEKSAEDILGPLDALKLRSSMTLFERAAPGETVFGKVLDAFFRGNRDPATLDRLER